jgi:hypothetical protein
MIDKYPINPFEELTVVADHFLTRPDPQGRAEALTSPRPYCEYYAKNVSANSVGEYEAIFIKGRFAKGRKKCGRVDAK